MVFDELNPQSSQFALLILAGENLHGELPFASISWIEWIE
jgi:hypothetical protein